MTPQPRSATVNSLEISDNVVKVDGKVNRLGDEVKENGTKLRGLEWRIAQLEGGTASDDEIFAPDWTTKAVHDYSSAVRTSKGGHRPHGKK